jgi:hypothetical protein
MGKIVAMTLAKLGIAVFGGIMAFPGLAIAQSELILVVDAGKDRICAFNPADGSTANLNFVPDDGQMTSPIEVVATPWGTLLVSDAGNVARNSTTQEIVYVDDAILEYGFDGQFIRKVVGGLDVTGGVIKGVGEGFSGLCVVGSTIYFSYCDAPGGVDPPPMPGNQSAIWRVDADGTGLQQVCSAVTNPALGVVRDIVEFNGDFLVTDSDGDDIELVQVTGCSTGSAPWHDSNGSNGIHFPRQIMLLPNGVGEIFPDARVAVGGFSAPGGIYVYDGSGNQLFPYTVTGPRGLAQLDNGEWIYTGGTQIRAMNPVSGNDRQVLNLSGSSFWYVTRVSLVAPCPGDLDGSGSVDSGDIGSMLLLFGSPGPEGDLDASGSVDAGDIGSLLILFGDCP